MSVQEVERLRRMMHEKRDDCRPRTEIGWAHVLQWADKEEAKADRAEMIEECFWRR